MPESLRHFLCARCRALTFICTSCDRGQVYCPGDCARAARQSSRREANRRYARTAGGRLKSASRSQRYRDRQRVTDQGSLSDCSRVVLDTSTTNSVAETSSNALPPITELKSGAALGNGLRCSFCGYWSQWTRRGPLRRRSARSGYIIKEQWSGLTVKSHVLLRLSGTSQLTRLASRVGAGGR
jgi:hypothetical protein